ncbi:MAG: serine O-acetyltransferase [Epsilonproteobacteria bacterium]|nr:serine O-acetyltransferase [Campylobacterota bacterium]
MGLFAVILEDFQTVKKNDPAFKSNVELFFNYPGVWALFFYRIANFLHKSKIPYLPRMLSGLGLFLTSIDIHPAATIGQRVFIDHGIGVVIGETAIVEDDVLIYQQVTLGGVSLDRNTKRHPTIKSGSVIGAGAKVLGNIVIGENARIGANSVVVRNVPDNSTAIGIPARVIEKGFDKSPLSHNKIPDIDKEVFGYIIKRLTVLENAIISKDTSSIDSKDHELEQLYQAFLKSVKN